MKRITHNLYSGLFVLMLLFTSATLHAQDQEKIMDMEKREVIKSDAMDAKMAFMRANPELESMLNNAAGYAIFPNVGKGAWILGGAAGNGIVYENGQVAGYAELRQIDIGFQFGGKAFRELIVFQTQEALDKFKEGNFEFGGSASAVIWDKGKGKAITFENGAGVAIMPKAGAMAGISVGGQEFDYRPAQ
ncbi:lipid-binding SYLF domain-containing protein [Salinimicrobium sp. HB62]|uniref:lipid-binding SYLF domain-containing protein n=1 Tax=Salinimicrobium sp. HB62 TaxID=3077781 RepID=UPI002D7700B6|nr:lipid-binding SYLF domain-containing protein [Salinimicrobium sp. HB62]